MKKQHLTRFGVSIDRDLVEKFDALIRRRRYKNRSEAIRDLVRKELVEQEWAAGGEIAGGIGFVYNHHQRTIVDRLTDIQHDHMKVIVSAQHVHLDHDHCLEMITVKGKAREVAALYDAIRAEKGVKHAGIIRSATGRDI